MKRTNLTSCVIASILVLFAVRASHAEPVKLEFRYQEGSTVTTSRAVRTEQSLVIAGMEVPTDGDQEMVVTTTIGNRNADGSLEIDEKIKSLKLVMGLPGGQSLEFDSTNPDASDDGGVFGFLVESFRATAGTSWTKVINKDNRVTEVRVDTSHFGTLSEMARELMRGQFEPDKMRDTANQERDILNSDPVDVGDFWQRSSTAALGGGQTMEFETQYEYVGTVDKGGKTLHKINSTVTTVALTMDAGASSPAALKDSDLAVESSAGFVLFDREQGLIVESQQNFRVVGDLTLVVGAQELPGELDLTMEIETTTK